MKSSLGTGILVMLVLIVSIAAIMGVHKRQPEMPRHSVIRGVVPKVEATIPKKASVQEPEAVRINGKAEVLPDSQIVLNPSTDSKPHLNSTNEIQASNVSPQQTGTLENPQTDNDEDKPFERPAAGSQKAEMVHEPALLEPAAKNDPKVTATAVEDETLGIQRSQLLPFTVQTGAFRSRDNAQNLAAELRNIGYRAIVAERTGKLGSVWYLVRIGNYATVKEADEAAERFRSEEKKAAVATSVDYPLQ